MDFSTHVSILVFFLQKRIHLDEVAKPFFGYVQLHCSGVPQFSNAFGLLYQGVCMLVMVKTDKTDISLNSLDYLWVKFHLQSKHDD